MSSSMQPARSSSRSFTTAIRAPPMPKKPSSPRSIGPRCSRRPVFSTCCSTPASSCVPSRPLAWPRPPNCSRSPTRSTICSAASVKLRCRWPAPPSFTTHDWPSGANASSARWGCPAPFSPRSPRPRQRLARSSPVWPRKPAWPSLTSLRRFRTTPPARSPRARPRTSAGPTSAPAPGR